MITKGAVMVIWTSVHASEFSSVIILWNYGRSNKCENLHENVRNTRLSFTKVWVEIRSLISWSWYLIRCLNWLLRIDYTFTILTFPQTKNPFITMVWCPALGFLFRIFLMHLGHISVKMLQHCLGILLPIFLFYL